MVFPVAVELSALEPCYNMYSNTTWQWLQVYSRRVHRLSRPLQLTGKAIKLKMGVFLQKCAIQCASLDFYKKTTGTMIFSVEIEKSARKSYHNIYNTID